MAILQQLELNQSVFYHFIIFAIAYVALSKLVFTPYAKALDERENRTKGGESLATESHKKAEELRVRYESKAREINTAIKAIFDENRVSAAKEHEKLVLAARTEAQTHVDLARAQISKDVTEANSKLKAEVPFIAQEMVRRLLAK